MTKIIVFVHLEGFIQLKILHLFQRGMDSCRFLMAELKRPDFFCLQYICSAIYDDVQIYSSDKNGCAMHFFTGFISRGSAVVSVFRLYSSEVKNFVIFLLFEEFF